MKNVKGIVRNLDDLGRVVIPKEMRRSMGIKEGDPVEISMVDNSVSIKKYSEVCHCCNSKDNLQELPKFGIKLCSKCLLEMKEYADTIIKCLKEN